MTGLLKSDRDYERSERFNRKVYRYYAWVLFGALAVLGMLLLYAGALLTGFITLALALFLMPVLKKHTARIPKILRILIILGLIFFIFLSMYLYI